MNLATAIVLIIVVIIASIPTAAALGARIEASKLKVLKEWLTILAGPITILAALIAALPVFDQLDDTRLGSQTSKIGLIRSALESIDRERADVHELEEFAYETLNADFVERDCESKKWREAQIMVLGFRGTPDKPRELQEGRLQVASSLSNFIKDKMELCQEKDISRRIGLFNVAKNDMNKLSKDITNYDLGVEFYKQVRVQYIKIWEESTNHIDYAEAIRQACNEKNNPLRRLVFCNSKY